jgi:uncharacterized protein with FMN-binding domain
VNRPIATAVAVLALVVPPFAAAAPAVKPKPKPKAKVKPKPKPAPTTTSIAQQTAEQQALDRAAKQAAAAVENPPGAVKGAVIQSSYGLVWVTIVYKAGAVTDCDSGFDTDRPRSRDLMGGSFPTLCKEALDAQSAKIHQVSGATVTSNAFVASLQSALVKAHLSTVGAVLAGPY